MARLCSRWASVPGATPTPMWPFTERLSTIRLNAVRCAPVSRGNCALIMVTMSLRTGRGSAIPPPWFWMTATVSL